VADTTIKIDADIRDRLEVLARARGCTVADLIADLATHAPTREDQDARQQAATAYIREHLVPDFDDQDVAAGEKLWRDLASGRATAIG
jgi:predicted DNA-binding ribbon-helix-helix protein